MFAFLKYYSSIFVEELRKVARNLNQDSYLRVQNLNAGLLNTQFKFYVTYMHHCTILCNLLSTSFVVLAGTIQ
jgi:hypothetical protein